HGVDARGAAADDQVSRGHYWLLSARTISRTYFTARLDARRCSPRTATRTISPLGSPRGAAHLARFLEPFHRSARRAALLTSHGHPPGRAPSAHARNRRASRGSPYPRRW